MNVQMVPQRRSGMPVGTTIAAIVMAGLFLAIMFSLLRGMGWINSFDAMVEGAVVGMRFDGLSPVMRTISFLGSTKVSIGIIAVFAIILAIRKQWKALLFFVVALGVSIGVCFAIKFGVGRPRPLDFLLDAELVETEPCFPSGHAWTAVMLFGLIYTIIRTYAVNSGKLKGLSIVFLVIAIVWPLLVGFSRLYMGEHYPTDVCAGLLGAGFFLLLFSGWYFRRFKTGPAQPYTGVGSPDYDPWQSFVAKQEDFQVSPQSDITQLQQPAPAKKQDGGKYVGKHSAK